MRSDYKAIKVNEIAHEIAYELLTRPPFSPKLALSVFFYTQISNNVAVKKEIRSAEAHLKQNLNRTNLWLF